MGASTVKWIAPDPCPILNQSGSKLYTNFKFCEENNHNLFRNILIYKAKQFMTTNQFQEKCTYFRDDASGVQVGDIEHVVV